MQTEGLTYEQRRDLHVRYFSLGSIGKNLNDKLILISLLSLTYMKMKVKKPDITLLDILKSITKQAPDNSSFYQMLESLSIVVEDYSYGCSEADSCGLNSSQDIINKIKEILSSWLPF